MIRLPPAPGVRRFSVVGLFIVVFALIAGIIWVGVLRVGRSFVPQGESTDQVSGLSAEAVVVRDQQGIPYVTAASELDAYTAIGYAHAQDRLWQMDLVRRAGEGRLSEVFGRGTIGQDALLRTIGFRRVAVRILEKMPASTRTALEAYARGVNRFIETHHGSLPFEFDALDFSPEPWTPLHSVLVGRLLAWELNAAFGIDAALGSIRGKVDSARFSEILPSWPADGPTIIPGGSASPAPSPRRPDTGRAAQAPLSSAFDVTLGLERSVRELLGMGGSHIGSNAWAVSPKNATSGRAMLANDPHLMHAAPGRWYQVVMIIGNKHRAGVTIPGVPFIVIGRNDRVAWGITAMAADETDFYIERLDSVKGSTVLHDGAWEPLKIIRDTIGVRDSASVPFTIRLTRHGPIISDVHPMVSTLPVRDSFQLPPDTSGLFTREVVSMRWTGADPTQELAGFERINRAQNLEQFTAGTRMGGVPGLVFVYADAGGRIAAVPTARVPVRDGGNRNVPLPGWESRFNWRGYVPAERLPRLISPARGWVASANNKLANGLPFDMGNLWEDPSRAERLEQLLQEGNRFAVVDFVQMQSDVVSPHLRMMTDYLLGAFPDSAAQRPMVREAIGRLRRWNGGMVASSPEAAIAAVWFQKLIERTFRDELGPVLFTWFVNYAQLPIKSMRRIIPTESSWFDDVTTPARRDTRDQALRLSLGDALEWLRQRYGDKIDAWRYGTFHTLRMPHVLGREERLRAIVDVGPIELGGSNTTLNNGEWDFNKPFDVRLGPSMRQIVDFGDTVVFLRSVVTTGSSGQPLSQFYTNQTILWSANGHVNLRTTAPEGTAVSSRTVLVPPGS